LFSHSTRYYLRRRAWRFFRRLGFQNPAAYPAAVARALMLYQDEDLAAGEDLLECWGLASACFRHSPVLTFEANRIRIASGCKLADLVAAPRFESLWAAGSVAPLLLELAT